MKKLIMLSFLLLTGFNIVLASWYIWHNDINFSSDIARDFLLLEELDEKKFILIGPRSSVAGIFHGPLWLYLNYPAYLIGNGNPIVVGWFWIILLISFLASSYFFVKKLFDQTSAMLFVLMASLYIVYHVKGFFNPHGALFLLPAFFFLFIRFIQTLKIKYLILHVFIAGLIIQFQMAVGIPFFMLSAASITFLLIRRNKKRYLFTLSFILIPLSTFFLFELKHGFLLTHSTLRHLGGDPNHDYLFFILQRLKIMISGIEFLRFGPSNGSLYVFIIFAIFLFFQILHNKFRLIYLSFLYFYIGFFLLSLINKYSMLYFYVFPIFPFVFLIFSSFATSKYKYIFFLIFFSVYFINMRGALAYIHNANEVIGKAEDSWKALFDISSKVYQEAENEFGYFVYSPDVLGYGPKYAMKHTGKFYQKKTYSFEKRPQTFLIIAPPPRDNPFMEDEWWRKNQVNISSEPLETVQFVNGYKIEKYMLTEKEISTPFDPAINPGIHFR